LAVTQIVRYYSSSVSRSLRQRFYSYRPTLFIQDSTQAGYGDDPSKVCPSSLNYIKQRLHILLLN